MNTAKTIQVDDGFGSATSSGRRIFTVSIHTPLSPKALRIIVTFQLTDGFTDIVPTSKIGWAGQGVSDITWNGLGDAQAAVASFMFITVGIVHAFGFASTPTAAHREFKGTSIRYI